MRPKLRPDVPLPGQESVWDYPRPPRIEPTTERVLIALGGEIILDTQDAARVLETSHPPDRVAVYAGRMDYCEVDGERVLPQAGGFYGGWTTGRVAGPFKGEPGTLGW
jgi:hypothetical protein